MQGTLDITFSKESMAVSDEYVQLLLRLSSVEKDLCSTDDAFKLALYSRKIDELQYETQNTKRASISSGNGKAKYLLLKERPWLSHQIHIESDCLASHHAFYCH